jgi:protein-disulfide isomerase
MKSRATVAVLLAMALGCAASFSPAVWAADGSSLKLPPGAKVAVVVFEDLQCPDCARAYPVVWDAANAHHIPVVLHDFPLPKHNWSFQAAVFARFFDTKDTKSQKLGNDYRGYVYRNQNAIADEGGLLNYTKKFADDNKVPLPFAVDPDGKLTEQVRADYSLGQKIGLEHTPTIFVIGQSGASTPFVEVVDRQQLSQIIEDMQKNSGSASSAPARSTKARAKKAISN